MPGYFEQFLFKVLLLPFYASPIFICYNNPLFTGDQTCWNGWQAVGDSCFRLYDDKRTWDEAQAVCKTEKAALAKLDTEEESYFVFLNLIRPTNPSSSVWIGLSRDTEKKFHWSDGSLVGYTNWGPNLPDTSPGNRKNCTKMNEFSGLWENEEFDLKHPFVCGRGERK